jgi:cephalosporin-C deacetylase-like acetyl esterase
MVDYLCSRPEVDRDRLGLWGMSMGSYWGLRCAALEPRLKAVATALGCYSDMRMLFDGAQPNFKRNYMFMSGYEDEDAFDRELAAHMNLWDLAPKITCAVLMAVGEFDELMNLSDAYKVYDMLAGPKELCVFEDEFHPLGGVAAELMSFGAEWLAHGVAGDFSPTRDERRFMRRSGEVCEGSAQPPWWTPTPGGHGTL